MATRDMDAGIAKPLRRQPWLASRPWAAVMLLMLVGTLNYLDRVLPSILAEPIKHELVLSDTALGVINGVGFLLIYACATIPLARMSDSGRYSAVVSLSLGVWSLMTLCGAFAMQGWQLAASRMGVAVGEAGGMPAAHAFITRHFPPHRRALALAIFGLSLSIGTSSGFVIGGLVGQQFGWRHTFLLMGGIGLVLALLTWIVLPGRDTAAAGAIEHSELPSTFADFRALVAKRSLILTLIGSAFVGAAGYTAVAFTPAFLMRSHGYTVAEAGLRFGLIGGIGGGAGLMLAGWLADRLSLRDARWLLGVDVAMLIVCLPISFLSFRIADPWLAVIALAVNYAIPVAYSAPVIAALHRLAPLNLRAQASALLLMATGIFGGFGPLIAGMASDALTPKYGAAALGHALLIIPFGFVIAAVCYLLAMISFRREMAEE